MGENVGMVEMTAKTDRELLLEAVLELRQLRADFNKVSNGTGFPRCAARGEKISNLEKTMKWLRNSYIGGIIALALTAIAAYLK